MAFKKFFSDVNVMTDSVVKFYNTADSHFVSLKCPAAQGTDLALTLPGADTSNGAIVSNGSGVLSISQIVNANVAAAAAIAVNKLAALTISSPVRSDGSGFLTTGALNLATETTGTLAIGSGGTGQTTKAPAFDALSPMSASGDIIYGGASGTGTRLAKGSDGQILTLASGLPSWAANTAGLTSPYDLQNYSLAVTVGASAMTVTLKDAGGSTPSAGSPVVAAFRSSTLATGTYSIVNVTGATSLTVASGATLGQVNNTAAYCYVYELNNAGTGELAIIQGGMVDEQLLQSTTALSGSSNSAGVLYSTTARSNVAVRYLGRFQNTQTTAGTWAATPTEISINKLSTIGVNTAPASAISQPMIYTGWKTLTVTGTNWSTGNSRGRGIYDNSRGEWWFEFQIQGSVTSTSHLVLTVSGVTFNFQQAITVSAGNGGVNASGVATAAASTLDMNSASATTQWSVYGMVQCQGIPAF